MESRIRSLSMLVLTNRDQRVKEFEIRDEEGVDLGFGIEDSLLPNVVL